MSINPRVFEALQVANDHKKAKTGENLTQAEINAICISMYRDDKEAGNLEGYSQEEIDECERLIKEHERILLQTIAGLVADVKEGKFEQYGDPDEPDTPERLRQLVGQLLAGKKGDLIRQLLEEQEAQKGPGTATYRKGSEARKDGAISKLPEAIVIPTLENYLYSMSWKEDGNAYLQLLTTTDGLMFKDGKLYFSNNNKMENLQEISEVELQNLKTKEGIDSIDLPLLRMFYSIILEQFEKTKYKELKDYITLYLPDLAERLGLQRNIGKTSINALLEKVQNFHNIVGVLHTKINDKPVQSYYPVLNFEGYNGEKNTISFSSPYMNYLIKTVYRNSIMTRKGKPLIQKNGVPSLNPSHSYLIKPEIGTERNKAAVENVFLIVQTIERTGDGLPHIKASTLIERNPLLQERLNESKNKRQLLQRTFTKTWELLRTKTRLTEFYKNIKLPDPKNPANIPGENTLDTVFTFPHDGKNATEEITDAPTEETAK